MSELDLVSSSPARPIPSFTTRPLPAYTIAAEQEGDTYLIRLRGELACAGSRELQLGLHQAEQSSAARILLDVEALRTLDSGGLRTILEASRRSARNGNRLRVTRGHGHVADLFHLTALDHTLQFTDASIAELG